MAPLTTSEIIANADYLRDEFDPKSLTLPQLRGIFSHHNISYAGNANKSQLVALFNSEIRGNIDELREERMRIDGSQASDRGITDAISGRQINDPESPPPAPRRSSRRSSARPSEPPEEPTKPSRRTSAGPSTSRARSRARQAVPDPVPEVVEEVSDSEDEEQAVPVRPAHRTKKGKDADSKPRRSSSKFGEDSGWEDNNVFQSGPDDSPPAKPRASTSGPRRSTLAPTTPAAPRSRARSRSRSRPPAIERQDPPAPVVLPSRRVSGRRQVSGSAPAPVPEPILEPTPPPPPPVTPRNSGIRVGRRIAAPITPASPEDSVVPTSSPSHGGNGADDEEDDVTESEPDDEADALEQAEHVEEHNNVVSERMGDLSSKGKALLRRSSASAVGRSTGGTISSLFLVMLAVLALTTGGLYKTESAAIGFCDPHSDTNVMLDNARTQREFVRACNAKLIADGPDEGTESENDRKHSRIVDGVFCPLPSLVPFPPPDACTPCPKRATCERRSVSCNAPLILRPHPIVQYLPYAETIFSGAPGFGPIAFPPTCVEDRRRLKQVDVLEKVLEGWLAKTKGDKICKGLVTKNGNAYVGDGGDARAWGVTVQQLRSMARQSLKRRYPEDVADGMFGDATAKLEKYGLVLSETDASGTQWIAALRSDMDLVCQAKVLANDAWDASRAYLYSLLATAGFILYLRHRLASSRIESARVASLVALTLETLRRTELEHHTDPVSTPVGYISSAHLRDDILAEEHSMKQRKRIWDKVERVVEGNANVRSGMEEVGGDVTRAWQWTGGTAGIGMTPPTPRRVQWTGSTKEEDE